MLILDTHVWIWLINGNPEIERFGFLSVINKAMKDRAVKIPAVCLWEVSMLASRNRIVVAENTLDWLRKASSAPGISIHPLTPEIAYESTVLPGSFHGDPADRMIVATARLLDGTLLTRDKEMLKYSQKNYVRTR